ncbi:MAG: DUF1501 domain-containing protein [Acidobacteria bacterium]|nr:DUF1501 domain-containing protein [Acidobacteriota bacterium]
MKRRSFLRGSAGIAAADCLSYLASGGAQSLSPGLAAAAEDHRKESEAPSFLIYWFVEGGWMSYDMFSPVLPVRNDSKFGEMPRDPKAWDSFAQHLYRVKDLKPEEFRRHGQIFYGPLAEDGKDMFNEMAIVSSMKTGGGHSTERWRLHYGQYKTDLKARREPNERTVLQAFCEATGRPYLLPNLNWHRWLSDGELDISQYPEGTGVYHALGPVWAHSIYPQTPKYFRHLIGQTLAMRSDERNKSVQRFLAQPRHQALADKNSPVLRSFASALDVYNRLLESGQHGLEPTRLFNDARLREEFRVSAEDEEIHFQAINGSQARSKNTPNINVQAMMLYEMLTKGLSCAGWLENRLVRGFDHHQSRESLASSFPFDQRQMMRDELWTPLRTLVGKLKSTEYKATGRSYWDYTTIVITSEFGRMVNGDIAKILANSSLSDEEKRKQILSQDIVAHNPVTSCAFMGPRVRGGVQFGMAGQKTMQPIPIHARTGEMDPRFDSGGNLKAGYSEPSPGFIVANHGHTYATALKLAGVDPQGVGRNEETFLPFVMKG